MYLSAHTLTLLVLSEQFGSVQQLVEQLRKECAAQKQLILEQQMRLDEQDKLLQTIRGPLQ